MIVWTFRSRKGFTVHWHPPAKNHHIAIMIHDIYEMMSYFAQAAKISSQIDSRCRQTIWIAIIVTRYPTERALTWRKSFQEIYIILQNTIHSRLSSKFLLQLFDALWSFFPPHDYTAILLPLPVCLWVSIIKVALSILKGFLNGTTSVSGVFVTMAKSCLLTMDICMPNSDGQSKKK